MTKSVVINKDRVLPRSRDYAFLREQGLEYIRELSGQPWTDHNSHDPGITILEILCYALTDLGYRTGFDIQDLLATPDGQPVPPEISGLFPAPDVMTCSPLTIDDYRRLLLRIEGVRNAWVDPMTDPQRPANYLRMEVPIHADCLANRLSYEATNGAGGLNEPVRVRGLYNVLLDLEFDTVLGPLNQSRLVHHTNHGKFKGILFSIDLPEADATALAHMFRFDFQSVLEVAAVAAADDKQFMASVRVDTAGGTFFLEHFVLRVLNDRPSPDADPVTMATADWPDLLADNSAGGVIRLWWRKQQLRQQTVDSARCVLHAHRNLCEDFFQVRTAGAENIAVCADVEVAADADLEEVQARVFFAIEQYLHPPIRYYSLNEMLDANVPIDDIFNGPYSPIEFQCDGRLVFTKPGFVKPEELPASELRQTIHVSDIISAIMDINGVIAVRNVILRRYDDLGKSVGQGERWCLEITPDHQPFLDIEHSKLLLFKERLPYRARLSEFQHTLDDLRARARKAAYVEPHQVPEIARGRYREPNKFFSIQHEFPETYGIGQAGLPIAAEPRRVAKARQLKAYLTLYDQLLADYLAQLANIRRLFSLDESLGHTYFSQYLTGIPGTRGPFDDEFYVDKTVLQDEQQRNRLTETEEQFIDRRNRVLDHLLARFSETFTDYVLMMFHLQGDRLKVGAGAISDKIAFLREYPRLSRRRYQACNYRPENADEVWDTPNVSGLQRRVSRLVGISDFRRRDLSCSALLDDLFSTSEENGLFRVEIRRDDGTSIFRSLELFATRDEALAAAATLFPGLRREASYAIDTSGGAGQIFFSINYQSGNLRNDRLFESELEAVRGIRAIVDRYDALLTSSEVRNAEGFHLIEHILLRPMNREDPLMDVCLGDNCESCGDEDPYSFRIHVVLPYWPRRFQNLDFRRFFEQTLRLETPAHIHVRVCWIDNTQMIELDRALRAWLEAKSARNANTDVLRTAANELIDVLQRLKTVYPSATLHDCDVASDRRSVRLGTTNLGVF